MSRRAAIWSARRSPRHGGALGAALTAFHGTESVALNGAGSSDPDGTITSYDWSEDGSPLATGATPTVTLTVGTHTITLTVTDNDGVTATDQVVVAVEATGGGTDPTVDNCSENSGFPGERMTVAVTGSGFQNGAAVDFGERITLQVVTFVNSGQLDVRIRIHNRATAGTRDVTVMNTDGGSYTLPGCFTVN